MAAFIVFLGFLIITSILFALVEIQIEGSEGWAAKLPTWKIENKWTRKFYGARPLTGYHLYVQLFLFFLIHIPFGLNIVPFNFMIELRLLSFMILFWVLEDFLWFVINPAFGLKKFKPEFIWWHAPNWYKFMPRDYWIFIPVGLILYVVSVAFSCCCC